MNKSRSFECDDKGGVPVDSRLITSEALMNLIGCSCVCQQLVNTSAALGVLTLTPLLVNTPNTKSFTAFYQSNLTYEDVFLRQRRVQGGEAAHSILTSSVIDRGVDSVPLWRAEYTAAQWLKCTREQRLSHHCVSNMREAMKTINRLSNTPVWPNKTASWWFSLHQSPLP